MSGSTDHGLKDLFGSVPDTDGDAETRPSAPRQAETARPKDGGEGVGHGLAGLVPGTPPAAPVPPVPPAPQQDQQAPSHAGTPAAPQAPAVPAAPAPATDAPAIEGLPPLSIPPAPPPASPAPAASALAAPLACVLIGRGGEQHSLGRALDALRRQTAARQVDVIIVGGDPAAPPPAGDLAGLTVLPSDPDDTDGQRVARGVQAAGGDLVALLDDYAFPAGDWAERILTHRHEGFGALGSALGNANPRSKHSWSHMLLEYGPWREGFGGGEVSRLPARNLVYRRETLAAMPDLAALLDRRGGLPRALASRGLPLVHDAEARLAVLNPSRLGETLRARYAAGRLDAAEWRQGLSAPKRTAKAFKAALGGYARYKRERARLFTGDAAVSPKQHGGAVALAMMSEGVGRAMGFLRGPGDAAAVRDAQARARLATLNKTDRRQFERPAGD